MDFEDAYSKANEFNDYFAKVGKNTFEKTQANISNMQQDQLSRRLNIVQGTKFRPVPVTTDDVILTVKSLSDSNAFGCDGITVQFIRDALYVIVFYLTIIINTSITTGVFPAMWKHGQVIPQYKSGDVNNPCNYRPVTLLPVLSKILEKIITTQLTKYLESNNLLSNSQHGFRRKLSTETALITVTDQIYKNMDQKKITVLSLCDLSKAFDSINHEMLLHKLTELNIDTFWFKDYLRNRTQSVILGKIESDHTGIEFGVPQGSILGPPMFIIQIDDLILVAIKCLLVKYADDAQFIHADTLDNLPTLISNVENTLSLAKNYFDRNGLLVNAKKTLIILIGNRQLLSQIPENVSIKYDGNNIIPIKHAKNLGVYFDRYMSFDIHIEELAKKVMGTLIYINRIKDHFDKATRLAIIESLVFSQINYCLRIWGSANKTLLKRIQRLQNFAARIVDGNAKKYDHVTPILKYLNWLNIEKSYKFRVCTFVYDVLHGKYPDWFISLPAVHEVIETRTRQSNHLYVGRVNTDIGGRAMTIRGPTLWNRLPIDVREVHGGETSFKRKLKYFYHD